MKLQLPVAQWWPLAKKSAAAWVSDYAPSMGAALSYYTVFSLAPMLLIVIAVAGLVFGQDAARGALFEQLSGMMGADAAKAVEGILANASKPSEGIIATVIGIGVLLLGATTVFGELQDSLDRIWRAPVKEKGGGLWGLLRTRFLSFGMILGIAFLLMVSLVAGTAVSALGKWWSPVFGGWEVLAHVVTFLFGLVVTTIGFAMIYKLMPRVKVQWHDVWIGAVVTAVLFSLGRFLIGLYIGKSGIASGFGAAGSLVIVFVWVYYSAQIFLLGAEFTWVYATTFGSKKDEPTGVTGTAEVNRLPLLDDAESTGSEAGVSNKDAAAVPSDAAAKTSEKESPSSLAIQLFVGLALQFVLPRLLRRLSRSR